MSCCWISVFLFGVSLFRSAQAVSGSGSLQESEVPPGLDTERKFLPISAGTALTKKPTSVELRRTTSCSSSSSAGDSSVGQDLNLTAKPNVAPLAHLLGYYRPSGIANALLPDVWNFMTKSESDVSVGVSRSWSSGSTVWAPPRTIEELTTVAQLVQEYAFEAVSADGTGSFVENFCQGGLLGRYRGQRNDDGLPGGYGVLVCGGYTSLSRGRERREAKFPSYMAKELLTFGHPNAKRDMLEGTEIYAGFFHYENGRPKMRSHGAIAKYETALFPRKPVVVEREDLDCMDDVCWAFLEQELADESKMQIFRVTHWVGEVKEEDIRGGIMQAGRGRVREGHYNPDNTFEIDADSFDGPTWTYKGRPLPFGVRISPAAEQTR